MGPEAYSGVAHRVRIAKTLASYDLVPGWSVVAKRTGEATGTATLRLWFAQGGRPTPVPARLAGTHRSPASAALTTATSKMDAVSFSLPAGTVRTGGSCIAAQAAERMPGHICRICYAWGRGNYGVPNVILSQYARLLWLQRELGIKAPEVRLPRGVPPGLQAKGPGPGQPAGWLGVDLPTDPVQRVGVVLALAVVATNVNRTVEVLRPGKKAGKVRAPPVPFCRIHDSGDFFHPAYVAAWAVAIDLLQTHKVKHFLPPALRAKADAAGKAAYPSRFWAPTRMWALVDRVGGVRLNEDWVGVLGQLTARKGVSIRPSALRVGESPPTVPGLSAGTGVGDDERMGHRCPVYHAVIPDPVSGVLREARSCTEARCRVCWTSPQRLVFYGEH